jgi:hypothetical protein
MQEEISHQIEQNGERWAACMDRTQMPVILALSNCPGCPVWELTLPPNEPHPFWRIHERVLTEEEAGEMKVANLQRIGSIFGALTEGMQEVWLIRAYVKNGRGTNWTNSAEKMRVTVEKLN